MQDFTQDINDIGSIAMIPSLLDVICRTTGMGFSAVARVTEDKWITCKTNDLIGFGLKPGDELEIKTTICNEIRQLEKGVIIDHVSEDPDFKDHHTPAMYGFQSYISVPIKRKDGSFFGTLCAIDPKPKNLKTAGTETMFTLFADLISFHLNAIEELRENADKLKEDKAFIAVLEHEVNQRTQLLLKNNESLEKINKELQVFNFISSHDLQEPLRKIQTFSSMISEKENKGLSIKGRDYVNKIKTSAERMQSLINDLLIYSKTAISDKIYEDTDLYAATYKIINDLEDDIVQCGGKISVGEMCTAQIIPFQYHQMVHNLVTNSIKFARKEKPLHVIISAGKDYGANLHKNLVPDLHYCHLKVSDNGIGFEQVYSEKIFQMFQRLHDKAHYSGTGIGLSIVKKIAENHNGFVYAESKEGEGATFNIFLQTENNQ